MSNNKTIAIIGLGYVGLPLAVEFAKKYHVIGYDIDKNRVNKLAEGIDLTLEVDSDSLQQVLISNSADDNRPPGLFCTTHLEDIKAANVYIVTVPTPTDKNKRPVLTPLLRASEDIGGVLDSGDYVIYESTVYPGVTEEVCIPKLEEVSGLEYNSDFFVGYSPERINPGDKDRTVTKILKVTSGSTRDAAKFIDALYNEVISAGTHMAPSIKVAEAAKVIENSQRDINIAFVNELAKIFSLLDIDTHSVLEAAGTKWNFLPFKPGLVGGHCIGVDPYYLAQKAQEVGYHPEIILSGRRLNDSMGKFIASETIKLLIKRGGSPLNSKVLLLGLTFKENCPDIRNTKVIDVYNELLSYGMVVDVYDPWASASEVKMVFDIDLITELSGEYEAVILAVAHKQFINLDIHELTAERGVVYDVKGVLDIKEVNGRL